MESCCNIRGGDPQRKSLDGDDSSFDQSFVLVKIGFGRNKKEFSAVATNRGGDLVYNKLFFRFFVGIKESRGNESGTMVFVGGRGLERRGTEKGTNERKRKEIGMYRHLKALVEARHNSIAWAAGHESPPELHKAAWDLQQLAEEAGIDLNGRIWLVRELMAELFGME